ncbi:thiamine pyrophosphate-dependent enzyme, partial [Micromonospora carbonacea]|uniref:thiamine pyrophosphate-dependent enzyme n=1 Tax=Micromonospora carbonacea TaxID=47853 RepID=UPI00332F9BBB
MLSDVTTPQDLDDRFREALAGLAAAPRRRDPAEPVHDDASLTGAQLLDLFDAQVTSRQLDLAGRWLRSFGEGFYTIGSAGHEGNAAVAAALRPGDPALLHYRSGAFYCLRAAQAAGEVAFPVPEEEAAAPASGAEPTPSEPGAGMPGAMGPVVGTPELGAPPPGAQGAPSGTGTTSPGAEPEAVAEAGAVAEARAGAAGGPAPGRDHPADGDDAAVGQDASAGDDASAEEDEAVREDAYAGAARDVLRGMVASAREPIAGGRHKVFGRADLAIVPTTSTIASHLPRAVGAGLALERLRRRDPAGRRAGADPLGDVGQPPRSPWPPDAIVVCSFGDASVNHASATAAFNTAGWYDHTGLRIPVLFVCEDNGLGISVRSPKGWVEATLRSKPGIRYFSADGTDPVQTYAAAVEAAGWVRRHRRPAVLHLSTVRLMGHAGADAETAYRSAGEIAADLDRDPVLATARLLVAAGVATTDELLARYDERGWQVRRIAEEVLGEPKLASAAEVVAELAAQPATLDPIVGARSAQIVWATMLEPLINT